MVVESDTLTIEIAQPGIRAKAFVGLVGLPLFFTGWCRHFYGQTDFLSKAFFWFGLIVGPATLFQVVDLVRSRWRLNIDAEKVCVRRQGLLRKRQWSCPRRSFSVGEVEPREHEDEHPDRFIDLQLSGRTVRFMEGHKVSELEAVRSRIIAWTRRERAA